MVVAGGLEHRRLAAAAVAASCAHPPSLFHLRRRLNGRKVSSCEKCWRWTKSVGVLMLVAVTLFVSVFCSGDNDNDLFGSHRLHHLEERSVHLRNKLDKKRQHTAARNHNHNGISKIRKLHGTMQKSKNIILLSYPRSGASILGELLSIGPNSAYFLEPFGRHHKNHSKISTIPLTVEETLEHLFSCQENILEKYMELKPFRVIHKLGRWKSAGNNNSHIKPWKESASSLSSKCLRTTVRVVETTRANVDSIMSLMQRKVKSSDDQWVVVHLLRDPRYVLDVRSKGQEMPAKSFCDSILSHMELAKTLPEANYQLVRYEDLHSVPTIKQLYAFLGLSSWLIHAKEYLSKNQTGKRNKIGSLKMAANWKRTLPTVAQKKIEKDCKKVIKALGYSMHSTQTNSASVSHLKNS